MDQYRSNAGSEFFSLDDDGDIGVVRFLHEGEELVFDEDWFIVHEIEIDGKKRYVRCPETSNCPGCNRLGRAKLKLFIQLVDKNDPERRKIWDRGNTFVPKIRELIEQYGDLCNRTYEIERKGKKRDRNTTYEIYPLNRDDMQLDEIPVERQKLLDGKEGFVLDLTDNEMHDAIDGRLRLERRDERGDDRGRGGRDDRGGRGGRDSGRERGRGYGDRDERGSSRDRGRDSRDDRGGRDSGRSARDDRPAREERSSRDDRSARDERGRGDDREDRNQDRGRERARDEREDRDERDNRPAREERGGREREAEPDRNEESSGRRRARSGDEMF
jgi:hypothetical protein